MKQLKYILFVIGLLANLYTSIAQTCCTNTSNFELLALNADFKDAHLSPEPFEYTTPPRGE